MISLTTVSRYRGIAKLAGHRPSKRMRRFAVAAVAIGLPLSTTVLMSTNAAAKNPNNPNKSAGSITAAATATVTPSVVTWGLAGNDVVTITATGLSAGKTYYEQVQSLNPVGSAITFVQSFVATATGGIPAPMNTWEMDDPYNISQIPPPTFSGPAEVVITSSDIVSGWSLSGTPVVTAPFSILPGQNTLVN